MLGSCYTGIDNSFGTRPKHPKRQLKGASPCDIIGILPGIYNESINITKSLILRGISGKDRQILFAPDRGNSVRIFANSTRLESLSLTGAKGRSMAAVQVQFQYNIIANNTMQGNAVGIFMSS
jgi:nitrous oxidase accessory protein NosD